MKEYFYLNGEYVEKEKAVIPIMTHGFIYGTSIFEGIRAYYNPETKQMYAFRLFDHLKRFEESSKIMRIGINHSIEELTEIIKTMLKKTNYQTDVYIRPTAYKAGQTVLTHIVDNPDGLAIFTTPLGNSLELDKGLKVCVSNWRRTSDNAIPPRAKIGGAYANAALMATDAKLAGFDNAIALSEEGFVTEGSAMNVFFVMNGKLVTPKPKNNILLGITRDSIIKIAKDEGIEVVERTIQRTELYNTQEAFYTGTSAQISPITSIDNRNLGDGKIGKITKFLQDKYFDTVRGKISKYKDWCTSVYD